MVVDGILSENCGIKESWKRKPTYVRYIWEANEQNAESSYVSKCGVFKTPNKKYTNSTSPQDFKAIKSILLQLSCDIEIVDYAPRE